MFHDIINAENVEENYVKEFVKVASKLGIEDLIIAKNFQNMEEFEKLREIANNLNLKIALKINSYDVKELLRKVKTFKSSTDLIIVEGKNVDICRKSCEMKDVDVVVDSSMERNPNLDHIAIQKAVENKVAIGFNFNKLLNSSGWERVNILQIMRRNLKLCKKYRCNVICFSGAKKTMEMRKPRDICALLSILGLNVEESINSVSENYEFLLRKRGEMKLGNFIPGVRKL